MTYSKDNLTIEVSEHGAELTSLRCNGQDYLWNGDATYWNRHSPVLFPVVGKPYNNEIHVDGDSYPMKQHGFARDSEFEQVESNRGVCFRMKDTDRHDVYPYRFGLEVTYIIEGSDLWVCWYVENLDNRDMYYQIGAHPAFLLPDYNPADDIHGYIQYKYHGNAESPLVTSQLKDGNREDRPDGGIRLPNMMPIRRDTFAHDALMIEDGQVNEATLYDKKGVKVLSVYCLYAAAFGIWAPTKEGCPFVCLEPWEGICDKKGFTGDISQRDLICVIKPGDHGHFDYRIRIHTQQTEFQ